MKKILALILFVFSQMAFSASCSRYDLVGKWIYQDGKTIAELTLSDNSFSMTNLTGSPLVKIKSVENGALDFYPESCKFVLHRKKTKYSNDRDDDQDSKYETLQSGILIKNYENMNSFIGSFKDGTMFRQDEPIPVYY